MDITSMTSSPAQSVNKLTGQEKSNTPDPVVNSAASVSEVKEVSQEELVAQTESLNRLMSKLQQSVTFSVDQSSDSTVVQVVDKATDELIRQIPSEDALRMLQQLQAYLEGVNQAGAPSEGLTGSLINEII